MDKFSLSKKLKEIVKRIIELYHPEKIILFGSYADEQNDINDIDLFIVKNDVP